MFDYVTLGFAVGIVVFILAGIWFFMDQKINREEERKEHRAISGFRSEPECAPSPSCDSTSSYSSSSRS